MIIVFYVFVGYYIMLCNIVFTHLSLFMTYEVQLQSGLQCYYDKCRTINHSWWALCSVKCRMTCCQSQNLISLECNLRPEGTIFKPIGRQTYNKVCHQ